MGLKSLKSRHRYPSEANTILSSPTEDSSITIPSVNDTPTLINGPLPTFFESKHQSYIIHDLTTADPTDSWFERRPYHAFDFRHGHHQAEVYRNVGNVFVHNHFLLQLDELNHSISEINLPLSDSTMSQVLASLASRRNPNSTTSIPSNIPILPVHPPSPTPSTPPPVSPYPPPHNPPT
ncbi:hypothetical protein BC829DRAFT_184656 [Chytridium lagenaria]|nr:hypothetical protein BC829DRAFT_184656 [Chytridium lagenaria]